MGKIIDVDFQKKQVNFNWTDDQEQRIQTTEAVHKKFLAILDDIMFVCGKDDTAYVEHCARTLGQIVFNLRGRL